MNENSTQRPLLKLILISANEPRLRSGWRLVIQTLLLLTLLVCLGVPAIILISMAGFNPESTSFLLIMELISLPAITLSVFLARRFLDKRSFVSLGLKPEKQSLSALVIGFLTTFLMMTLIYLMELAFGWIKFEGFAWEEISGAAMAGNILLLFITFSLTGWNEEVLTRGYYLQNLTDGTNKKWGVILSSAIFGILHLGNPNATWLSVAGIFLAGGFFAWATWRSNGLWLAIGLHIGWNFFESGFGFPVSGLNPFHIIEQTTQGPAIWTGGAFGPEAGLILLPALILGIVIIHFFTRNHATKFSVL